VIVYSALAGALVGALIAVGNHDPFEFGAGVGGCIGFLVFALLPNRASKP